MSYDLAVWEGERPADDKSAARCFRNLYDRYIDADVPNVPPTDRITAYVGALLERWPESRDNEESPWSDSPLIGDARGPLIYFAMRWSMAIEASSFAAELAASMHLVCFDPQARQLRP